MNKSDLVYYLEMRIKDCKNKISIENQRLQVYTEILTDVEKQVEG